MNTTQTVAPGREFVISRVLDAPRDLVWKCFTDPEHMKQWWGPKGVKIVKSEMDLRVGGTYHYGMQTPDGSVMWGKHGLPRDHAEGSAGVHQLVLRRERRPHPPSDGADLAHRNDVDLHLRRSARQQDQVHRPLVAAQRHATRSARPSTTITPA